MSRRVTRGFTLVELMLSMSFIGVMLLAIAMCVIQISTIYSRGETVRQLNQAMRATATDIERTISSAHPFTIDTAAKEQGRLCTGRYTYVWNTPTTPPDRINRYDDSTNDSIQLVRVSDPGKTLCDNTRLSDPITRANAVELMEVGDRSLKVYAFDIRSLDAASVAGQQLYTLRILMGTDKAEAIDATSDTCKAPSEAGADTTYCAINEFTITVRAGIG